MQIYEPVTESVVTMHVPADCRLVAFILLHAIVRAGGATDGTSEWTASKDSHVKLSQSASPFSVRRYADNLKSPRLADRFALEHCCVIL